MLDAMLERPDADPDRVAVIGISQAGYRVSRALAFEHHFAAAAVDSGVVDVSSSWLDPLPEVMRKQLRQDQQAAFDREMHLVGPALTDHCRHPAASRHALRSGRKLDLRAIPVRQRLPARRGDPADHNPGADHRPRGEQFWPGQSQQLYDRLKGPKHLVRFRSQQGAGRHCEPLECAQRDTGIFDWLDQYSATTIAALWPLGTSPVASQRQ